MTNITKTNVAFAPHPIVRSGHLQTYLAQIRPRNGCRLESREYPVIVDGGPDHSGMGNGDRVKLFGYYCPQGTNEPSKGLVVLLHGWEGCSHSTYNLVLSESLGSQGYDVFRLNMRDHGPAFHLVPQGLNMGMFLATLIEEIEAAICQIVQAVAPIPAFIVGVSMGGNFALRVASRHDGDRMANLRHVIAISPSVNPEHSVKCIDARPALQRYYRKSWLRSLRRKETLFPDRYQFDHLYRIQSLRGMTEWLVRQHTGFPHADAYFASYAVTRNTMLNLGVDTTILAAHDDPVVPSGDIAKLVGLPQLDVRLFPNGGHVGFVDIFPFRHYLPNLVLGVLDKCRTG